ncbi:MAG: hypothetical protein V4721_00510 [Bacteroidota bacterium]
MNAMPEGLTVRWRSTNVARTVNAVTQFLDITRKGIDTDVQSTSTMRPTYDSTNTLGGKPTISLDNGDTLAITGKQALFDIVNGPNTSFIVAKRTTEAGATDFLFGLFEGGANRYFTRFESTAGQVNFTSNATGTGSTVSSGNTNTNFENIRSRRSGTAQAVAVNGGTPGSNTSAADEPGVDAGYIGSRMGVDSFLAGAIVEILQFNRALSANEALQVEIELANEWELYHPNAPWITHGSDYSPLQRALIHAWKLNKSDAFTTSSGNPFALIIDSQPTALGAAPSLIDYSGRGNTATEATNPPINTAGAIGANSGLLYNGTTTILNAGSDASIDDIFAAGGFFIGVINPTTVGENIRGRVWEKTGGVLNVESVLASTCKLRFSQVFSVTAGDWITTNRDIIFGTANIIALSYNSASVLNDPVLYINSITPKAITETFTPTLTASSDAAFDMIIGNRTGSDRTFEGSWGCGVWMKSIPTTEQLTSLYTSIASIYGVTLS